MANIKFKYKDNVAGKFYVDEDCIYCGLCAKIAPANFKLSAQRDHDIVYMQPVNEQQLELCKEAMQCCPVEAIGDDGDL